MSKYPKFEYGNTQKVSTRKQNEAKYLQSEYSHTQNMSMAGKLIRVQAEQIIRETPGANCRHSAWIEDVNRIAKRKYGIRGDADA